MTYIDYLNGFNRWLENNSLAPLAQVMYFRLLDAFNRAGWPEWVSVDTLKLMTIVQCEVKTTVFRARDALVEAGFLEYKRGKKGQPNKYRLTCGGVSGYDSLLNPLLNTIPKTLPNPLPETLPIYKTKTKTKTKTKEKTPTESKRKAFSPPSVEEVRSYCLERGNGINPQSFVDYYAARGWKYGQGKPVVDWKAAVRTWENRRREEKHGADQSLREDAGASFHGWRAKSALDDAD